MPSSLKLLVIGGVAAGASCAARARRLCENAEIMMIERGPDDSAPFSGLASAFLGCPERDRADPAPGRSEASPARASRSKSVIPACK